MQQQANKSTKAQTKTSIRAHLAKSLEGHPLLGYVVCWSTAEHFKVKYDSFIKVLKDLDIPEDIANEIREKSAFTRAMHNQRKKGVYAHKVVDDQNRTGMVLVKMKTINEQDLKVRGSDTTQATMDKKSKGVEITGEHSKEVKEDYEALKDCYTANQFRAAVIRFIFNHCEGISVRDRGGMYFIPSHKNEDFKKLEALFAKYPGNSLTVIPVVDGAVAKNSMMKTMTGDVEAEIENLKKDFENMKDDSSSRSVETRLEKYKKLRAKVENYEDLLAGTAVGLKEQLDKLSKAVVKKLKEDEEPEAKK